MISKMDSIQSLFYQHPKSQLPLPKKKKNVVEDGKTFGEVLKEVSEKKSLAR
jgi:hypothetical protein